MSNIIGNGYLDKFNNDNSGGQLKIMRDTQSSECSIAFHTGGWNRRVGMIAVSSEGELRFYDINGVKHTINYI